jgi:hypothetical protein
MVWPQMLMLPESAEKKPVIIFMVVDFPAPLGPKNPTISGLPISKEMSSTAL